MRLTFRVNVNQIYFNVYSTLSCNDGSTTLKYILNKSRPNVYTNIIYVTFFCVHFLGTYDILSANILLSTI